MTPGALAAGTDVNAKGKNGWTPLHRAAIYGRKEIVELLIAKGAEVNAKDNRLRKTPLDVAIMRKHGGKTGYELKAERK